MLLSNSSRQLWRLGRAQGPSRQMACAAAAAPGARDGAVAVSLVSPQWLMGRLGQVKVLDASWYMPAQGRDGLAEHRARRIPGAAFFPIDDVADTATTQLPHMLPSEAAFAAAMDALGITNEDQVVVYDGLGVFSAPRAWWTLRVFGHENVAVLNGGLPAWEAAGGPVSTEAVSDEAALAAGRAAGGAPPPGGPRYRAKLDAAKVRSMQQMLANVGTRAEAVVDARSPGRFVGTEPEPRPGLRGGHIPGARNVPFPAVLQANKQLKPAPELAAVFTEAGVDVGRPLVGSCGSGLTACILALAVHQVTGSVMPIYDGSWSEWGAQPDTPVDTQPQT